MKKYLSSQNLWVRFISMYTVGVVLFLLAWTVSFYYLPEGIMKSSSVASRLAGEGISSSLGIEFGRLFFINIVMSGFIVAANYVLKINQVPLGYIIPAVWFINYGLILGSNSFTFTLPQRMGPSLYVLQRSGIYEMAAYTLLASATYNFSKYEIKRLFKTNPEKIREGIKIAHQQYVGIILAILILLLANLREVIMIFNQN